jgi:hypothetical protein
MVETSEEFIAAMGEFYRSMMQEIETKTNRCAEQAEECIELQSKIKVKSAVVTRELAEMANIFRDFSKKYGDGSKTVFAKTLEFYLDALN